MATISFTRNWRSFAACNRRALTLIEIMASILVLAVGLVGVLAAIPFGGMRLAQMNEADSAAAMGRNAARLMKFNAWADPDRWFMKNQQNGSYPSVHDSALYDGGDLNLTYPFFVDPLGKTSGEYLPEYYSYSPSDLDVSNVFFTRVAPTYDLLSGYWDARYERDFYLHDVISGFADSEDDSQVRPRVEMEKNVVTAPSPLNSNLDKVVGSDDVDSFTGRYSWLATVTLKSGSETFRRCSPSDVVAADYDVAVFQDRIVDDEKAFAATLEGSGYQGGVVRLDLTTGRTCSSNNAYLKSDEPAHDEITRKRIVEQLETTRYIMLFGRDDASEDGAYRCVARWYKIANYAVVDKDADGAPTTLRLNLVGENTPTCWANGDLKISALFFPGVIGVYSGTTSLE